MIILRELAVHRIGQKRKILQEDRMRSFLEVEEWTKICCTEAVRAKQLRMDELSIQEKE